MSSTIPISSTIQPISAITSIATSSLPVIPPSQSIPDTKVPLSISLIDIDKVSKALEDFISSVKLSDNTDLNKCIKDKQTMLVQINSLNQQLDVYKTKVFDAQKNVINKNVDINNKSLEISSLRTEINRLNGIINDLQKKGESSVTESKEVIDKLKQELENKLQKSTEEVKLLKLELDNLKKEKDKITEDNKNYTQKMSAYEKQISDLNKQSTSDSVIKQQLEQEMVKSKAMIKKNEELMAILDTYQEMIKKINDLIDFTAKQKNKLNEEKKSLDEQIKSGVDILDKNVKWTMDQLAKSEKKVQELEASLLQYNQGVKSAVNDNTKSIALEQELIVVKSQLENYKKTNITKEEAEKKYVDYQLIKEELNKLKQNNDTNKLIECEKEKNKLKEELKGFVSRQRMGTIDGEERKIYENKIKELENQIITLKLTKPISLDNFKLDIISKLEKYYQSNPNKDKDEIKAFYAQVTQIVGKPQQFIGKPMPPSLSSYPSPPSVKKTLSPLSPLPPLPPIPPIVKLPPSPPSVKKTLSPLPPSPPSVKKTLSPLPPLPPIPSIVKLPPSPPPSPPLSPPPSPPLSPPPSPPPSPPLSAPIINAPLPQTVRKPLPSPIRRLNK